MKGLEFMNFFSNVFLLNGGPGFLERNCKRACGVGFAVLIGSEWFWKILDSIGQYVCSISRW